MTKVFSVSKLIESPIKTFLHSIKFFIPQIFALFLLFLQLQFVLIWG